MRSMDWWEKCLGIFLVCEDRNCGGFNPFCIIITSGGGFLFPNIVQYAIERRIDGAGLRLRRGSTGMDAWSIATSAVVPIEIPARLPTVRSFSMGKLCTNSICIKMDEICTGWKPAQISSILSIISGHTRYDGGNIVPAAEFVGACDETLHALLRLVLLHDTGHFLFRHQF